ncbi:MAG: energy transducer TonB, partial [Sphingomicrobium sp.]
EPPPPEEPPPPPKDMPDVPPPPTMPPPIMRMAPPTETIRVIEAPTPPIIQPVAPAPPPPPPPPRKTQSATSAKGDLRTLFSADDYPSSAQSSGAEGTVRASLSIGPDGRVTGCNVIQSSGNGSLDSATCSILRRRAKFVPARDSNGNAVSDTITTPPIRWQLEG